MSDMFLRKNVGHGPERTLGLGLDKSDEVNGDSYTTDDNIDDAVDALERCDTMFL